METHFANLTAEKNQRAKYLKIHKFYNPIVILVVVLIWLCQRLCNLKSSFSFLGWYLNIKFLLLWTVHAPYKTAVFFSHKITEKVLKRNSFFFIFNIFELHLLCFYAFLMASIIIQLNCFKNVKIFTSWTQFFIHFCMPLLCYLIVNKF